MKFTKNGSEFKENNLKNHAGSILKMKKKRGTKQKKHLHAFPELFSFVPVLKTPENLMGYDI